MTGHNGTGNAHEAENYQTDKKHHLLKKVDNCILKSTVFILIINASKVAIVELL